MVEFKPIIRAGHIDGAPPDSELEQEGWRWLATHRGGRRPGAEYTVWILYKPMPDVRLAARKLLQSLKRVPALSTADYWQTIATMDEVRDDMAALEEALEPQGQKQPDEA